MAPAVKSGGGGKSKPGATAPGSSQPAQGRTIQTRSQRAGLQVRGYRNYRNDMIAEDAAVPCWPYSPLLETTNPT